MMELKPNKYVVYSIIVLSVALVAFNFEKITGQVITDKPTEINILNIKPGNILSDRMVARLEIKNSFPSQRIRVYADKLDRFAGYSLETENCVTKGGISEYTCEGDLYISSNELTDGETYYFQALDRHALPDGNKARFVFKE
jgi:hypothetical protein